MRARYVALAFYFTLVATLFDQTWVRLGVMVYPQPFRFGQAWWVPFLFAAVGPVIVQFFVIATRLLLPDSTPQPRDPGASVVMAAAWFSAAYVGGALFDDSAETFAVLLLVLWLIRMWFVSNSVREAWVLLVLCLVVSAAGTLGESGANWLDLMRYPRPDFWKVPYWLPFLWLHAALFARELARAWFGGR